MPGIAKTAGAEPFGPISGELQQRGVRLSCAAETFADPPLVRQAAEATERFRSFRKEPPEAFRDRESFERLDGDAREAWFTYRYTQEAMQIDLDIRLMRGALFAFGDKQFPGTVPEWIPRRAWKHLHADPQTPDHVRSVGLSYWYVRVIDAAWIDAPAGNQSDGARRQQYSEARLGAWFRLRVDGWPQDEPPPTETTDLTAAKLHFDSVPRDKFREVRRKKVPENWLKPGPRRVR